MKFLINIELVLLVITIALFLTGNNLLGILAGFLWTILSLFIPSAIKNSLKKDAAKE